MSGPYDLSWTQWGVLAAGGALVCGVVLWFWLRRETRSWNAMTPGEREVQVFGRRITRPARAAVVHDWTARDYTFTPAAGGLQGTIHTWETIYPRTAVPVVGDYLILRNGESTSRYVITEVVRHPASADPTGMRTYRLRFDPREATE